MSIFDTAVTDAKAMFSKVEKLVTADVHKAEFEAHRVETETKIKLFDEINASRADAVTFYEAELARVNKDAAAIKTRFLAVLELL